MLRGNKAPREADVPQKVSGNRSWVVDAFLDLGLSALTGATPQGWWPLSFNREIGTRGQEHIWERRSATFGDVRWLIKQGEKLWDGIQSA